LIRAPIPNAKENFLIGALNTGVGKNWRFSTCRYFIISLHRALRRRTSCRYFSLPPYDNTLLLSLHSNSTRKPALH